MIHHSELLGLAKDDPQFRAAENEPFKQGFWRDI